ncbi:hypothetical protein [Microbacterium thalassium]|uniref:PH domain-containing protein n=1 Tax=Microbacterium thalassium TaxID=362649 RepID=A0A7X0FSM5_9MICO|nr:hypothetical protein [Microbacterium thalassium]MBB6392967.1 hypothetical protein [Microbacterium thalassium]GLK22800.1 hypothetical protein GCM10017607_01180 [Microbacterium thalassium]
MTERTVASDRIPGMVSFARALGWLPLLVLAPAFAAGWDAAHARGVAVEVWVALVVCAAGLLYVAVRALVIRIEVTADTLIVVQWYRTMRIPLEDIESVFSMGYVGMINWGGIGPSLGLSATINLAIRAGDRLRMIPLNVTLSLGGFADRKVARFREALAARGRVVRCDVPEHMTY